GTGRRLLRTDLHVRRHQLVDEAFVLRRHVRVERLVRLRDPVDVLADDLDARDAAGIDPCNEVAEADRPRPTLKPRRDVPNEQADDEEHRPEQQPLERRVHLRPPNTARTGTCYTCLRVKISTAREAAVTRNASSISCPATHKMRSFSSTTSGTR